MDTKEKALHRGVAIMVGYLVIGALTLLGAVELTNKLRLGMVLRPVVTQIDASQLAKVVND
jgi:hypothetical protein